MGIAFTAERKSLYAFKSKLLAYRLRRKYPLKLVLQTKH